MAATPVDQAPLRLLPKLMLKWRLLPWLQHPQVLLWCLPWLLVLRLLLTRLLLLRMAFPAVATPPVAAAPVAAAPKPNLAHC